MKTFSKRILALLMSLVIALSLVMTASASDVVYGDINKDSKINSIDALMILQHSVGAAAIADELLVAADVNGDGRINSIDALEILMVSIGQLPYFSVEVKIKAPKNNNEILAVYNNAVKQARESIPAYKLDFSQKTVDSKFSGNLVEGMTEEELAELRDSAIQDESYSNIMRQGTTTALRNLPLLSDVTDASVFKSLSYERLATGEYSIVIKFKDEKNPTTSSPVVKLFGLPDYATMKANLGEGSAEGLTMKVGDMYYKNGYISFVLDPRTGEFVSVDMSVDMAFTTKVSYILVFTLNMDVTMRTRMQYTNFIY